MIDEPLGSPGNGPADDELVGRQNELRQLRRYVSCARQQGASWALPLRQVDVAVQPRDPVPC